MGRNSMGPKILLEAANKGTQGKFYDETEASLWRTRFGDVLLALRSDWNQIWDDLVDKEGEPTSGEQEDDVMEKLHEAIWKLQPQSRKKVKRKPAGGVPAAPAAHVVATGTTAGALAAQPAAQPAMAGTTARRRWRSRRCRSRRKWRCRRQRRGRRRS
ncbi:unnamed protein product, partial [Ectocarpus sp. 12 AP-2014]